MELLREFLLPVLTSFAGAFVGWFFGKAKEKAELQTSELDNVDKAVKIYREMIEDLGEQLRKAIAELNEAKTTIRDLEETIEKLTTELTKYKQLNGKAK
ncbi:MAG: cell wall anchor protein [Capnocytophaga felis]|nr:cell wall anchor protein [Capnocytophaga felis]